jgi:uncharacterized membrane protein
MQVELAARMTRIIANVERGFRHAHYTLRGGFLVRPLLIAAGIGSLGIALPLVDRALPGAEVWVARMPVLAPHDAAAAAGILSSIVGAIMTTVSIVLSVLLVAITFASVQFSPRILIAFVEDLSSQRTIGIFLGTFVYCLFVYPVARSEPPATAPAIETLGAMALACTCVVALVSFVHHISRAVNVSFVTERIAAETERVVDILTPTARRPGSRDDATARPRFDGPFIRAERSGYIRYIDVERLRVLAKDIDASLSVERRVGHFVAKGVPVVRLSRHLDLDGAESAVLATIDIGPVRTLEQDIEFGLLQLVDISLKAQSPGVNDPSTAINCIDQLSRILIRLASREPVRTTFFDSQGVPRVVLPETSFHRLLAVAYDQVIHYGKHDLAVSLRLMHALGDLASSTDDEAIHADVHAYAEHAAAVCAASLPEAGARAIEDRLRRVPA